VISPSAGPTRLPTARITLGRSCASREPTITDTPRSIIASSSGGRRGGSIGEC